jgi:hypothetical protein
MIFITIRQLIKLHGRERRLPLEDYAPQAVAGGLGDLTSGVCQGLDAQVRPAAVASSNLRWAATL